MQTRLHCAISDDAQELRALEADRSLGCHACGHRIDHPLYRTLPCTRGGREFISRDMDLWSGQHRMPYRIIRAKARTSSMKGAGSSIAAK